MLDICVIMLYYIIEVIYVMKFIEENDKKEKRINFAIDTELFNKLTERAQAVGVSRAELIRLYLERGLEQGQERRSDK
jgi:predicted DNA binding CopG/RHH family protein